MTITTMSFEAPRHDVREMHRLIICLTSVLTRLHQVDNANEQTMTKVQPESDRRERMALWRRQLVAQHLNVPLVALESCRTALTFHGDGGRALERTPALPARVRAKVGARMQSLLARSRKFSR